MEGIGRGAAKRNMHIEIHDAALEAGIQKQIHATGSASVEEALLHLLETQEEQDRWLIDNRDAINAKIRRGIAQLDRGEGIPEDELDAWLTEQKAKPD
jgi:predicted transcriptional regulator